MSTKVGAGVSGGASARLRGVSAEAKVEGKSVDPAKQPKIDAKPVADRAADMKVKPTVDAKTVADARRVAGAGDAAAKTRVEQQMRPADLDNLAGARHGVQGGLGATAEAALKGELKTELKGGGAKADLPEDQQVPEPSSPTETQQRPQTTKTDPYSKEQKVAQDILLKEGKMLKDSEDKPLPENLRTTADGKVLPENSAHVMLSSGNYAEMNVIKTPDGEYYKQMVDGPAVKMTQAEVNDLRENMKKNPHTMEDPYERVGVDYKHIYNDLVGPELSIDSEPH